MSEELWQQYKATGDVALRNRLVLTYVPLVKHIVYKKIRELPPSCEVEDLVSCGIESLIGAVDRFEERVLPSWPQLRSQVIHGDLSINNVTLDAERRVAVAADFASPRTPHFEAT